MVHLKLPNLRRSRTSLFSSSNNSASSASSTGTKSDSGGSPGKSSPADTRSSSPERPRPDRPKSEIYSSNRNSTIGTPGSAVRPSFPASPFAPRILSVQENQWVHQSLLLVFGQVGLPDRPCDGSVTVYHHLEGYPPTQWPVLDGHFKALVHLDPGPNRLRFEFSGSKYSQTTSSLNINLLPLAACPPLQLAILVAKNSPREYDCQIEKKQHEGNGLDVAVRKLRMAANLAQAFTGEQMYRNRLGRRCFRLEDEWVQDSLSNRDNGMMRNVAKVHIIRTEKTVDDIQQLEAAKNGNELWNIAHEAVYTYFESVSPGAKRHVAVLVLDAKGDLRIDGLFNKSALSSGLGLYGSRFLYTLPTYIEDVVPTFSDCTRIGTGGNDVAESGCFWEAATSAIGSMIEAFISPQSPTEPRDFEHLNRTFVTKEPYSFKSKSPGLKLCLPKEECSWPRMDCLRFRYHPCFRLPTDPLHTLPLDTPQVYAVENGIFAGSHSGIVLVEIHTDGVYRTHLEFTAKPEREVLLSEEGLRSRLPEAYRLKPMKLKILSAAEGETVIEDFSAAKGSKVQLPNGYGVAFKSSSSGLSKMSGSQPQEIILHTIKPGRMLTNIRVFHGSALDGLEFMYEDSSSQLFGHRGNGVGEEGRTSSVSNFMLDARKGESLLGFCVRSGFYVDGIEILTSLGRRSPFFGNPQGGSSNTLIPPRGRSIAGVSGSCAKCVDGFSILYK